MVFVKVRETYDLHTIKNKMSIIAIHTPRANIVKMNYPGLLMQCKAWRPVAADVKIACASVLPLDPLGVGTAEGDVAPEDVFNPILYKATSNVGMSQIEARIAAIDEAGMDVRGAGASVDVDSLTSYTDEFPIYYGLLSDTHGWKHANPQSGLMMSNLKPYVYEIVTNFGDNELRAPDADGQSVSNITPTNFRGAARPMPWLNCTGYTGGATAVNPGFSETGIAGNAEQNVPAPHVICGVIIIPPSRLHELFYRMVVEWTLEFSTIRSVQEITSWVGLGNFGQYSHFQNYDYSETKAAVTGSKDTVLGSDAALASANVDITKVM